jgi:hypothetical protein
MQTSQHHSNNGRKIFETFDALLILPQDSAVVQDPEGEGQIVYLFLPLYKVRISAVPQP